jgi:hypothetical protein
VQRRLTIPLGELSGFRVDAFIHKDLQGTGTGFGRPGGEGLRGLTKTLDCLRRIQIGGCASPYGLGVHETTLPLGRRSHAAIVTRWMPTNSRTSNWRAIRQL